MADQRYNLQEPRISVSGQTTQLILNERVNDIWTGLIVYLNVTNASGTGGLRVHLQAKVPAFSPATYQTLNDDAPFITATGVYAYYFHPFILFGRTNVHVVQTTPIYLPYVWRTVIDVGDASSYDYQEWEERLI